MSVETERRRAAYRSYSSSIFNVLNEVATSLGLEKCSITNKSMAMMNSLVNDKVLNMGEDEAGTAVTIHFRNVPAKKDDKSRVASVLYQLVHSVFSRALVINVRVTPVVLRQAFLTTPGLPRERVLWVRA